MHVQFICTIRSTSLVILYKSIVYRSLRTFLVSYIDFIFVLLYYLFILFYFLLPVHFGE